MDPKRKFRSLYRMLTKETMADTFKKLKNKRSAAGIDGQTYAEFESGLAENCEKLESELKAKRYRAPNIRRVNIPKPNGKTRPLGITTISDKVVQAPAAAILSAVYSSEFKECNFGYRTGKGAHQALDYMQHELAQCIGWVVEMDIEAFFDNINHAWLMKMLELKIEDKAFLRLIGKWLKANVMDETGKMVSPEMGCPQGGIISPVLSNIYLHYVLDLWFSVRMAPKFGEDNCMMVRYADDAVFGFRNRKEAVLFMQALRERLGKFGLKVSEAKTRLVQFGRFAIGKGSIDFLGYTLKWVITRKGKSNLRAETKKSKLLRAKEALRHFIRDNRNMRLRNIFKKVKEKLSGFYAYFGTQGNSKALYAMDREATVSLKKYLNRRSQRKSYTWETFNQMLKANPLPSPKIVKREAEQLSFMYTLF